MYNLLLILLTLKGEHADRDLTYEGSVRFDVMNTQLRGFFLAKGGASGLYFDQFVLHWLNEINHVDSDQKKTLH